MAGAVILNSRQPIRCCAGDDWVKNTIQAVSYIHADRSYLLSSVGMSTWELVTALGVLTGNKTQIYYPVANINEQYHIERIITEQFNLNQETTQFIPIKSDNDNKNKNELLMLRDRKIIENADVLIPVSIRPGGQLDSLIKQFQLSSDGPRHNG